MIFVFIPSFILLNIICCLFSLSFFYMHTLNIFLWLIFSLSVYLSLTLSRTKNIGRKKPTDMFFFHIENIHTLPSLNTNKKTTHIHNFQIENYINKQLWKQNLQQTKTTSPHKHTYTYTNTACVLSFSCIFGCCDGAANVPSNAPFVIYTDANGQV